MDHLKFYSKLKVIQLVKLLKKVDYKEVQTQKIMTLNINLKFFKDHFNIVILKN